MVRHIMYRLSNTLQQYAWGSPDAIFSMFSWQPTGQPAAELWLGAHASAPSLTRPSDVVPTDWADFRCAPSIGIPDASGASLISLIKSDPDFMLGEAVVERFGPRLPFLLKVLAAEQPLSLQVHPLPHVARAGFAKENAAGIALDSPDRNYKDDQHKPEMILALTAFEGLSGFRRPARALQLLGPVAGPTAELMRADLTAQLHQGGIQRAFSRALQLRETQCSAELELVRDSISAHVELRRSQGRRVSRGHLTALDLFDKYPADPGALVSLLLNRFSLEPGEAVFLAAGQVHAYLHGVGLEVMASSDNVLRAGLTQKRVDIAELESCTVYAPAPPSRPLLRSGTGGLTEYRPGVPEFNLMYGAVASHAVVPHVGPRIALCLSGEFHVGSSAGGLGRLRAGESAFIPHGVGNIEFTGSGELAVAYVP